LERSSPQSCRNVGMVSGYPPLSHPFRLLLPAPTTLDPLTRIGGESTRDRLDHGSIRPEPAVTLRTRDRLVGTSGPGPIGPRRDHAASSCGAGIGPCIRRPCGRRPRARLPDRSNIRHGLRSPRRPRAVAVHYHVVDFLDVGVNRIRGRGRQDCRPDLSPDIRGHLRRRDRIGRNRR
jgi:hypothetical protein